MIKLVVSDMDGTLLNKQSKITEGNLNAIHMLQEKGIEFAIASGRDYRGVYSIIHDYNLHCEAILGNGAQYVDEDGNVVMNCYMDKSVVERVTNIFVRENIPVMIFTTDGFYTPYDPTYVRNAFVERNIKRFDETADEYDEGGRFASSPCNHLIHFESYEDLLNQDIEIIKVEAFCMDDTQSQICHQQLKDIPQISYLSSFDDNCEVCDKNAQKGLILEKVIALKGLQKEEVAVLGDGMNDLTLFECFPYSFTMGNGEQAIKDLAYRIVNDCEDDGFLDAVENYIVKI